MTASPAGVPTLSQVALEIARSYLGVHEEGGNNRGPQVSLFLASVGLDPGNPWCAAFLHFCFRQASGRLGLENPFPKTGSSLKVWVNADALCQDTNPQVGAVYVLRHTATTGHVGIVETLDDIGCGDEISGNTNATGSREGNCVYRHHGEPSLVHGGELLGYLVFDRASQAARGP
jgi:hypothetical protein